MPVLRPGEPWHGLAQSLNTLTLWRFLTGLGLGAAMPNAITLISEFAPSAAAPWQLTPCTAAFRWVRRAAGRSRLAYPSPWLAKRAADRRDCAADFNGAAGAAVAGVGEVSGAARERRRQVRRIASRFARSTLDSVTGFFLAEEKVASKKAACRSCFPCPGCPAP